MFGCQQVLITPNKELKAVLEFICSQANKLHNCAVYYARQMYFKARKYVRAFDLNNELKRNPHYSALCAQAAQQVCGAVGESIISYKKLIEMFGKGELVDCPKLPNYRTKNGLHLIAYPKQALGKKLTNGQITIPLGKRVQSWFGLKNFTLTLPSNLEYRSIKEIRILPRNGCFYAEFVYKKEQELPELNINSVLGIDPGLNNWLTCLSNTGISFIVDGLHVKSLNQWYNKQVSTIKEKKPHGFWRDVCGGSFPSELSGERILSRNVASRKARLSNKLAVITEKRNRQMRDAVNKAARIVVNHCLKNKIGNIVFGWNKRQKDSSNMGRVNNQKFVSVPTAKLKDRIKQLCEQYGIKFVETEESYTSKASFVDSDLLPKFGEKPEGWKPSGRRTKRGLYRTALNWYINADCNGAANILRKVSTMLGLNLGGVSRGALTRPQRIKLWSVKQKHCEVAISLPVATSA